MSSEGEDTSSTAAGPPGASGPRPHHEGDAALDGGNDKNAPVGEMTTGDNNDPTSGTGSSDSDQLLLQVTPPPPVSSAKKTFETGTSNVERDGTGKKKASVRSSAAWIGVGGPRAGGASAESESAPKQGKGRRSVLLAPFSGGSRTSKVTRSETSDVQPGAVRVRGVHRQGGDASSSKREDDPTTLVQAGRGNQKSAGSTSGVPLDDIESGAFPTSTSSSSPSGGDNVRDARNSLLTAVTTATAVSQDDLEQEVRDRLRREAVVAQATDDDAPEAARDDGIKTKKTSSRPCRVVALIIIVASAIVVVTLIAVLTTGGSSQAASATNATKAPPRVWTPEELRDFIVSELGTAKGFELPGFTPAKASYELILTGGTFDNVTLGTQLMDAFVIMALWAGTGGGKGWTRSDDWNKNPYPCTWYGIGCNERGRVARISVPGNNLMGPLNPDLRYLADQLTHLDVSDNKVGLFKFNLTSLPNLQHFNFSNNANGGLTIENVMHYNLTRLEVLDLSSCLLGGPISPDIARLSELRQLHLQDNSLTGSIPTEIASLSRLTSLRLEGNELSGSIPIDVCSRATGSGENASVTVDCADVTCSCCFCETS